MKRKEEEKYSILLQKLLLGICVEHFLGAMEPILKAWEPLICIRGVFPMCQKDFWVTCSIPFVPGSVSWKPERVFLGIMGIFLGALRRFLCNR